MARVLVMSIKPRFAERIFAGEKRVELRRTRPHVDVGDVVLVYASTPAKAIVGAFAVAGVISGQVSRFWKRHSSAFGVSRAEYRDYFAGADKAHGVLVGGRAEFDPVPLDVLRRSVDFRPPQSYMFWRRDVEELVPGAAGALVGLLGGDAVAAE